MAPIFPISGMITLEIEGDPCDQIMMTVDDKYAVNIFYDFCEQPMDGVKCRGSRSCSLDVCLCNGLDEVCDAEEPFFLQRDNCSAPPETTRTSTLSTTLSATTKTSTSPLSTTTTKRMTSSSPHTSTPSIIPSSTLTSTGSSTKPITTTSTVATTTPGNDTLKHLTLSVPTERLLNQITSNIPAILVKLDFVSHPGLEEYLAQHGLRSVSGSTANTRQWQQ
ncbi:hypothetical protein COOONC_16752 [Cooperia oncophora]